METLQRLHNRGSISTGAYQIDNSCKFEADNTERMYRAWGGSGGGNDQTWTLSLWVKRTELGTLQHIWGAGVSGNDVLLLSFQTDNTLKFRSTKDGANDCVYVTNRKFRDTSAWYHIVTAVDTTSGTAGDRLRIYINGVEETSFSTETDFAQNDNTLHNANSSYVEIATAIGEADRFCGYIAEVISISGSQLAPTTFGETDSDTGIWIPIEYTGSFPQNSFILEFKDSSSLGTETSGNGQTFTLQNIAAADQSPDTPTNNYATWNALFHATGANDGYPGGLLISEGATEAAGISGWDTALSTIAVSQGKWYAEFYITGSGTPVYTMIGVAQAERYDLVIKSGGVYVGHSGSSGYSVSLYGQNGATYPAQDDGGDASKFNAGDLISVALDMDNQKIYWAKNGSWLLSDNPASNNGYALGWTGDTYFGVSQYDSDNSIQANFGGFHANTVSSGNADANGYGNFEYAPPTGYYALNTKNLNEFG